MRPGEHVTPQVRLVRPIGAGGMGAVWLADHLALKTQVAVKFILAGRENDSEARERFSREAEAAAQVKSPHVAQIFDHGVLPEDGIPFIVMELLEGEDLSRYMHAHGRLGVREASTFVTQMCRALGRAHSKGLIHRDVKPANIFLCDVGTPERFVKLLDFGVAKVIGGDPSMATKSGSVTGTPVYMAPEQLLGARDLDHRADLWSVAVVAYEMIAGRRPFIEETAAAIALRVHTRGMPRASEGMSELSSVSADALDAFFAKAWAIDPKNRFDNATELAEQFEAVVNVICVSQGVDSKRGYQLAVDSRHPSVERIELTVRERSLVSDVTLQSGRLEIPHPSKPTPLPATPPRSTQPDAPKTETPISRHLRESNAGLPPPEPPSRARWAGIAALALVCAIGLVAFAVGRKTGDGDSVSSPSSRATTAAPTVTPTPSVTTPPVSTPSASVAPLPSVSASATPTTTATATTTATVKKVPLNPSPSTTASATKKPLEVIE